MNKEEQKPESYFAQNFRRLFPKGVIEMPANPEESYFKHVENDLREKLNGLEGASLFYERTCDGQINLPFAPPVKHNWEKFDYEVELSEVECSSSYHLFFVGLTDRRFTYLCEADVYEEDLEESDEKSREEITEGRGWIGCSVAVSSIAPVAYITFESFEEYGPDNHSLPDIEPSVFYCEEGRQEPVDMEEHFREFLGEHAAAALVKLRVQISKLLSDYGIKMLAEEEGRIELPWLRASKEVCIPAAILNKSITVKDAFFFRGE